MSYYRPSFSQTLAMSRGRGFSSPRSSYRGGGNRGNSWSSRGSYPPQNSNNGRFSSFSNSFDSRSKYQGSDRYAGSRNHPADNYRKSYRPDSGGYSGRDVHRSPERKRMRTDTLSSRHDSSYGPDSYSRYESSGYPERRSFSDDRRPPPISRREEFRKPPRPTGTRGGYRGRVSARGSLRPRIREPPIRRTRLVASYTRRRLTKLRSAAIRRYRREQEVSKELKEEEKEEKKEKEEATEEDKEKTIDGEEDIKKEKVEGAASEKDEKKEESDDEERPKRKFVILNCPQCAMKCSTFRKYSIHLKSGRHFAVMRRVAMKQKAILHQMRLAQRKAQKELEKITDDLAPRTNFCPLCKLNYKQPKATHRATESHKNMKKFLMPYCKVCKITLKSPMLYEDHCCSIEHLKRKSLLMNGDKSDDGSGDDNLENFMTIDSVGDVEEEDAANGEAKKKEIVSPEKQINVGIESIRKVEVHYCDLCLMYLPRAEEEEIPTVLAKHCKQRTHMQRYIRFKEDKEIAKRAEKLQRKELAEKEKEKDKDGKTEGAENDTEKKIKEDGEDEGEDKLWADVDKDLGDILAEAESGNKSSDEDDNGERYDRFKLSEGKNGDEKKVKEEKGEGAVEETLEAEKEEAK